MTQWAEVFLGVIALATLAMAVGQVGLFVAAGRAFKRMERLAERLEKDIQPIVQHLDSIGRDASQATALAKAQVERADRLMGDFAYRAEETLTTIGTAMGTTAREGAAVMAGLRAALGAVRDARERRARSRQEEEDALFI